MATLRKGQSYRRLERPYTRKSKFKKKGYVKAIPGHKIVKFNMGNPNGKFQYEIALVSKDTLQIRQNAIESCRMFVNRKLQNVLGVQNYYFMLKLYPHHAQRENRTLGGAHADRIQTGMGHPFGKVVNTAIRVKEGKELFSVFVNKNGLELAKKSLKGTASRLPCRVQVDVRKVE